MTERVIALRIRLDGSKQSTNQVATFAREIGQVGRQLDLALKKANQLKALQSQIGRVGTGAGTGGGASAGAGNGTSNRASAKPAATNLSSSSDLRKQLAEAQAAGQSVDAIIARLGKLKAEQAEVNKEIRAAAREFENTKVAAGSYRAINNELVKLRDSYRQLSEAERTGVAGKETIARVKELDAQLKKIDADMGIYTRNVGNYGSAFNGLAAVTQRFLAFAGISLGATEIVAEAAAISDAITNVEKVSGLAEEQARALADQLRLRDTRTSLEDQLGIAEIGGRLGINADNLGLEEANAQLIAFTDAIDTANVALGDQFNNDAELVASTLAGLRNVLSDFRPNGDADVGGDLLRIGNALNFLETQGNSTAPVIADFVNRIGGAAVPLNASTESIFALSTTLDELEVSAERGSTAVTQTLTELAKSPENFASFVIDSGLIESSEAFTKLVNDDIISALVLVSQSVREGSESNTEFAQALEDIGIDGVRAVETFAKLGTGADRYRVLLEQSTEALSNTDSLTNEFTKKNNNLAAELAKLRNQLVNTFTSSEVQDGLSVIIQGISTFIGILFDLPRLLKENKVELLLFIAALVSLNAANIAAAAGTLRLAAAQKIATVAQRLLNIAMKANPIGIVVSLLFLLAGALVGLYNRSETFRRSVQTLTDRFLDLYKNSNLVRAALGPLGLAVKFLIDIFKEGPSVIFRYIDAVKTFASNIPPTIKGMSLVFQEFALEVRRALSFGDARERLTERLNDIRQQIQGQQEIIAANNAAYEARNLERRKEALAKEAEAEKKAAVEAEAARKKEEAERAVREGAQIVERVKAKVIAGKKLTEAEQAVYDALSDQEKEYLKQQQDRRKAAIEAAKKAAEEAAKNRLEAAKRILDLENELIFNRFDRQEAQTKTSASRDIEGLVGDPEQIARQTELIQARLREQLAAINVERSKAQNDALELVRKFSADLRDAQIENGTSDAQAELDRTKNIFDLQEKALDVQLAQQEAKLLKALRAGEITFIEFSRERGRIALASQRDNIALAERRIQEEGALDAKLTEQLLIQEQQRFDLLRAQRVEEQAIRNQELQTSFDQGDLSVDEFSQGLDNSDALRREQELADLAAFEQKKADLSQEFILRNLERVEQAANEEQEISRRNANEIIKLEQDKRNIILETTEAIGERVGEFLTGQQADLKTFLKAVITLALDALERIILVSIASSTAQSLAQPDSVATFGASGLVRSAILTGLIKGAFTGIKAIVQSFEGGGQLPGDGGNWSGGQMPLHSGVIQGRSHRAGGIRRGSVEVEGGEYKMRNGPETYIVNRASTARFRPMLDTLARYPEVFSPMRRAAVSNINAYAGYGVAFQDGGVLTGSAPLSAPLGPGGVVPFGSQQGLSAQDLSELREVSSRAAQAAEAAMSLAAAANSRIDRIRVINDPAESVRFGNDKIAVENRRGL